MLEWLAAGLGLARDVPALTAAAASVADSAGVRILPALAGLGSPWWQPGAHGVIAGLHGGVRPAHIARAALESIAWRVADIVEAMGEVVSIERLRVDGGLSNDATLLQIQADALGLPLAVGRAETTALGAALLAGVGAGLLGSLSEAVALLAPERIVVPRMQRAEREQQRARWRSFVEDAARL
jgi:glycerol kinase